MREQLVPTALSWWRGPSSSYLHLH